MVSRYVLVKRLTAVSSSGLIQSALKGGRNQQTLVQGWQDYQQGVVQKIVWLVDTCMRSVQPFVNSWAVTMAEEQGQVFQGLFEVGLKAGDALRNGHQLMLQNLERALQAVSGTLVHAGAEILNSEGSGRC